MKRVFLMAAVLLLAPLGRNVCAAELEEFVGARKDGSILKGYLSPPENEGVFPIAVL